MSARRFRLTRVRAGVLASCLAVVAIVAAGCASTVDGQGAYGGDGSDPTPTDTRTSATTSKSKDFPSPTRATSSTRSTSASTTTRSSAPPTSATPDPDLQIKQGLADIGTRWLHAYAAADIPTFCDLSDPESLQAVLAEKDIESCDVLTINWDDDPALRDQLASFAIPDPSDIIVIADEAFILAFDTVPENLTGMSWLKQADGAWKVDASLLSGEQ